MPVELDSAPLDLPDISKMPGKQAEPLQEEYFQEENEMVGWLEWNGMECFIRIQLKYQI